MSLAYERAEAAAFAGLAEAAGLPLLRLAGATCVASPGTPQALLVNRVTGLGTARAPSDDELDEIDAFFADAGARYAVAIDPEAAATLVPRLAERAFVPGAPWMKFAWATAATAPTYDGPLRVAEVRERDDFETAGGSELPAALAALLAGVVGADGWHCFVAYDGDRPVARAALCASDGDVGWLGAAGTLPADRGRGAQAALLTARLRRAADLGLDEVVVETAVAGADGPGGSYRNVLRAGFVEAYERGHSVSPEVA